MEETCTYEQIMGSATVEKRSLSTAFALSLAAGIIILFGGILPWLFWASFTVPDFGGMMGPGMMGRTMDGGIGWWAGGPWFMMAGGWFVLLPLAAGIIVLVAAILMNAKPHETRTYGIIVLVFSIIGFVGAGISIVGAILGIIGGIIALTKRF